MNFLNEIEKKGGKKGENYNCLVIPVSILDDFEKEMQESCTVEMTEEEKKKYKTSFNGLEIVISGEKDQIRIGYIHS